MAAHTIFGDARIDHRVGCIRRVRVGCFGNDSDNVGPDFPDGTDGKLVGRRRSATDHPHGYSPLEPHVRQLPFKSLAAWAVSLAFVSPDGAIGCCRRALVLDPGFAGAATFLADRVASAGDPVSCRALVDAD